MYAIIAFKLAKGTLLILAAVVIYNLGGAGLQAEFSRTLRDLNVAAIQGEWLKEAFAWLKNVSEPSLRLMALGTVFYAMFSLAEGFGLILRASWAGWAAICESAFFVPVEVIQMVRDFSTLITVILILNIAIVWYLYANRIRLFHSH